MGLPPSIRIPGRFDGFTLSTVVGRITAVAPGGDLPPSIGFDFSDLYFIRPTGVVFLSNLVRWLARKNCRVTFTGIGRSSALDYLDDSLFFEHHCGSKIRAEARPRSTTQPLEEIRHERVHSWLRTTLTPWLAHQLGITTASLNDLQTSISELFNNIKDHPKLDIGSIFVQFFPKEREIRIAVADFGVGIPEVVRRVVPGLTDAQAIIKAVEQGFTTKSIPTNQGDGLDILLKTVVGTHRGRVTIMSRSGIVQFDDPSGTGISPCVFGASGFCPGTTFEIVLPTDAIPNLSEESEDLEW